MTTIDNTPAQAVPMPTWATAAYQADPQDDPQRVVAGRWFLGAPMDASTGCELFVGAELDPAESPVFGAPFVYMSQPSGVVLEEVRDPARVTALGLALLDAARTLRQAQAEDRGGDDALEVADAPGGALDEAARA